jgi:DnaJ family protein C protein 11
MIPVLSNPHKRAIYDCLGKKGLEEQELAVVLRTKTPKEIREEYERIAK